MGVWARFKLTNDKFSIPNFQSVSLSDSPENADLKASLVRTGISATFHRLRWGLILSVALVVIMAASFAATTLLNQKARKSRDELITAYRLSWKIGIAAAMLEVALLVPLLAYGFFQFTLLLAGHYFPKLLAVIIIGGLVALWRCAGILLKSVPLVFDEHLSRAVTAQEAPELWEAVSGAAHRLRTAPPDNIVIGMQLNFYVTEMAVRLSSGAVSGRTLYLSYPLLKQLAPEEVLAVAGHELGHFIGDDTRLTREFYPLRFKARATMLMLARSGWACWTSLHFLNFFTLCFAETEQQTSRARELLADQKAAELTSPQTAARALVRFSVMAEAFHLHL